MPFFYLEKRNKKRKDQTFIKIAKERKRKGCRVHKPFNCNLSKYNLPANWNHQAIQIGKLVYKKLLCRKMKTFQKTIYKISIFGYPIVLTWKKDQLIEHIIL